MASATVLSVYVGNLKKPQRLTDPRWSPSFHFPWSKGPEKEKKTVCSDRDKSAEDLDSHSMAVQFWLSSLLVAFGLALTISARESRRSPEFSLLFLTFDSIHRVGGRQIWIAENTFGVGQHTGDPRNHTILRGAGSYTSTVGAHLSRLLQWCSLLCGLAAHRRDCQTKRSRLLVGEFLNDCLPSSALLIGD